MNNYNNLLSILNENNLENIKLFFSNNISYIDGYIEKEQFLPPLYIVLKKEQLEIANCLIELGANPNKCFRKTNNFIYGDDDKFSIDQPIISSLINYLADTSGDEPLKIYKKRLSNTNSIEFLIKNGADVNKPEGMSYTPLDNAVFSRHRPAIKLLKKFGAKHSKRFIETQAIYYLGNKIDLSKIEYLDIPYIDKKPPIFHASIQRTFENYKYDNDVLKLDSLYYMEKKYDKNQKDWKGRTPLDFAEEIGHHVAVEYLLSIGAKRSSEL